jgi:spore maturation protein CgeB
VNILLIGRFYEEGVATFIAEHLAGLGHQVVRFETGPSLSKFGSQFSFYLNRIRSEVHAAAQRISHAFGAGDVSSRLRNTIGQAPIIDLTLVTHDFLHPAEAALVKQLTNAPLALWYPDPIWSFQRHMFLNAPYDALFFKDPFLVDLLRRKLNAPVFYMPECYSPTSLSPNTPVEARFQCDICTAGNLYSYRVAFFRQLTDFDLKIWGLPAPLWMDVGPLKMAIQNQFVAHTDKAGAFRGAKIVLNNLNPAEMWGTNVRTFEVAGAGGFQITDWRPGLSQLFEIDKELVTFDDIDELRTKLRHYLAAPEERAAIAAAGHARAARDHTYDLRLTLLLDTMAGHAQGYPMPSLTRFDAHT